MANETVTNWNSFARVNASRRWREQSAAMGRAMTDTIVAEADVREGMHVLDIACGTGEPAISIATLLHGTGSVTGADISPDPLRVAEQRALERELSNINFVPADVHNLPFPDASFDRLTCRLGAMFFSDMPRAASQIHRVLKPGGRATLLAWGPMDQPYFDTTIGTILRTAGMEIPASGAKMFKFGERGKLPKVLTNAGFSQIDERFAEVPWNWPGTPEEFWEYFQEVTAPFKPLFEAVGGGLRESVHARVIEALRKRYDGHQVKFDAKIVLVSATK